MASGVTVSINNPASVPRNQSCVGMSNPVFFRFSTDLRQLPAHQLPQHPNFCVETPDLQAAPGSDAANSTIR
jgi:hypothetical protein